MKMRDIKMIFLRKKRVKDFTRTLLKVKKSK